MRKAKCIKKNLADELEVTGAAIINKKKNSGIHPKLEKDVKNDKIGS